MIFYWVLELFRQCGIVCFIFLLHWILDEEFEDTKEVNKNLYIEEEQTTQWAKDKVQKDKQRSTKHIYKTKERVTQLFRRHGIVCFFISLSLIFA